MNRDQELERLFKGFKPDTGTEGFIPGLKSKMDVVDSVRGEYRRSGRFNRVVSACCLTAGLLVGVSLLCLVLFHPVDWLSVAGAVSLTGVPSHFSLLIARHADIVLSLIASVFFVATALRFVNSGWGVRTH